MPDRNLPPLSASAMARKLSLPIPHEFSPILPGGRRSREHQFSLPAADPPPLPCLFSHPAPGQEVLYLSLSIRQDLLPLKFSPATSRLHERCHASRFSLFRRTLTGGDEIHSSIVEHFPRTPCAVGTPPHFPESSRLFRSLGPPVLSPSFP